MTDSVAAEGSFEPMTRRASSSPEQIRDDEKTYAIRAEVVLSTSPFDILYRSILGDTFSPDLFRCDVFAIVSLFPPVFRRNL